MKVSGQGVLVRPDVVMKDVVDVVSGHGLWYVDSNSVTHDDVSVKTFSQFDSKDSQGWLTSARSHVGQSLSLGDVGSRDHRRNDRNRLADDSR